MVAFTAQKMGYVDHPQDRQTTLIVLLMGSSSFWDNYKDYTDVGTLDGLYQHTPIATGTRLRPVEATFLGHTLGTKPTKNMGG